MSRFSRSAVTAVLGPTNTGKTHLAVERMLGHSSGVMGFPLRLLAREVYDRVVAQKGEGAAALVTGEERIWPETARYLLCTAEAMPVTGLADAARDAAFVAIDEVQLGQDRERGHVFTSRLLHARGREETMLLGSASMTGLVKDLVPEAEIIARPRFSTLSYDGPRKLSRLPARSVIVAFSAEEVYALAEALRRFSGGAAVVMGALSPRTRNAQVAMFQAGEVDYLVATDAIGMGLNLDVAHVAFASLSKFDGQRRRRLTVQEMAQIAGRAGRHQRDGSFGSVGGDSQFTDEEVAAIEEHRFAPIDWLNWRNPAPDAQSIASLIADLEAPPPHARLRAAPEAVDLAVLRLLADDAEVAGSANGEQAVRRLWSACSLPDFVKAGPQAHARLVARLWSDLSQGNGHIDADWFKGRLAALDNSDGSVEVLADRIAQVRTWCYIAQRPDWLADPAGMAALASDVETRLSDALHGALTARFVDRRTSVLLRALGQGGSDLPVTVDEHGLVRVDGEPIGMLDGFAFRVDPAARANDQRMLLAAAERHLVAERARRATALASAGDDALALVLADGQPAGISWHGLPVATLARGKTRLAPRVVPVAPVAALDAHLVAAIVARLDAWLDDQIAQQLAPLIAIGALGRAADTPPPLRALMAMLTESGGVVARADVDQSLKQLTPEQRTQLRRLGITVGTLDLYFPQMLKPVAQQWRAALQSAWSGDAAAMPPKAGLTLLAEAPAAGSVAATDFRQAGASWLRIDMVERVARHAHTARRSAEEATAKAGKAATPAAEAPVADAPPANEGAVATSEPVAAATAGPAVADAPPVAAEAVAPDAGEATADVGGESATPAPAAAPAPGSFTIDPGFATSLGLTREARAALYRLLGFRSQGDVDDEAAQLWRWRGLRAERPRPARGGPRRQPRAADGEGSERAERPTRAPRGKPGERRGQTVRPADGERPRRDRGAGDRPQGERQGPRGGKPSDGKPGGGRPQGGRPAWQDQRRDRGPSPHSPFAALADLFKTDKPDKS